MKTLALLACATFLCALFVTRPAAAADAPTDSASAPRARQVDTNAVPQSVFTIPTSSAQGRDPFYPNAHYLGGGGEIKRAVVPTEADTLELKALSGSTDHRLAMIAAGGTNRTLAVGEETEFRTSAGRMRVRCVEIKGESAVVEVDGERRELRLRD